MGGRTRREPARRSGPGAVSRRVSRREAVVFSLLHPHPNGAEERADVLGGLAGDVTLNLPVALALGYLALRGRSLARPTALHLFSWQP
jgi:hypothetical protein